MPPRKTKDNTEKEIQELKALISSQGQQIASQKKQIATLRSSKTRAKLIPKLSGQASRSKEDGGYNIQEAMGLADDDTHYHRLLNVVKTYTNEYLSVLNTISKQDRGLVDKTIALIQNDVQFFRQFEGGWPIRDIMRSYLGNEHTRFKKRIDQEREWEETHLKKNLAVGSSESAKSKKLKKSAGSSHSKSLEKNVHVTALETEDADDEDEIEKDQAKEGRKARPMNQLWWWSLPRTPRSASELFFHHPRARKTKTTTSKLIKKSGKSAAKVDNPKPAEPNSTKKSSKKTDAVLATNEPPNNKAKGKSAQKPSAPSPKASPQQKRKSADANLAEGSSKKKVPASRLTSNHTKCSRRPQTKLNSGQAAGPNAAEKSAPKPPLTWSDLPTKCPSVPCSDFLPKQPVARILALFERARTIKEALAKNPKTTGLHLVHAEICQAISLEKRRTAIQKLGEQRGWPMTIDFADISSRILSLKHDIIALFRDPKLLAACPVWDAFLLAIDYRIFDFVDSDDKKEFPQAFRHKGCGYYGPAGEMVIYSTLMRVIRENEEEYDLENSLCSTIHDIVTADDEHFQDYDPTSNYLTVTDFTSFILIPFAAISLIADDLPSLVDFHDALFERNNSHEFGELFHGEDDESEDFHRVHRRNIDAIKAHERERGEEEEGDVGTAFLAAAAPPRLRKVLVKTESTAPSLTLRIPPPTQVVEEEITLADYSRVTFSACQTGLRLRKRAFSGLGLDLGVDQSPSPADRLASPFVGLASRFARLAEKRAYYVQATLSIHFQTTGLSHSV
ncbi:hypothetical protein B0H11DRAFT_2211066 [Mycena galericulata]|nr:hypothetical protein B0H11DRAFT_2211066 [Mycena galericulata]